MKIGREERDAGVQDVKVARGGCGGEQERWVKKGGV